ncbi:NHL repeat-containing protein [Anaeromyxobacter oryzisoli]|uniref:hypothetical protein n=1 Tax=Anaeromyxobacter oryzisoli TaxID=2925408 RepID=UPI001F588ACF|nr:hypothetical protein [Anaeromyxobacter sp. SG63]
MRLLYRFASVAMLAAAACAGAPVKTGPDRDRAGITWPAPPQEPRLRLVEIHPSPNAPAPKRPWWRVALEWITGTEQSEEDRIALTRPFGVALAAGKVVFIADPDRERVVRIDAAGTLEDLTCKGRTWTAPMAVALDDDGTLFVADAGAGAVIELSRTGCRILGEGLMTRPTGVAVTPDRIWIADPPRHQVTVLSRSGSLITRIGEQGEGTGKFHFPSAVAAGPGGSVLVVDPLNFRIVRLAPDGSWLGEFGVAGDEGGSFARPKGIAVDATGTIYVSDAQRDEVLVFTAEGVFQYAAGATGSEPGRFTHPAGVAVLDGHLAVADSQNGRIQVFEIVGGRK